MVASSTKFEVLDYIGTHWSLELSATGFVSISLIAIAAGFIVIFAMIRGRTIRVVTKLFWVTTALTSLTGFLFPFKGITPAIVLGILSLIVLAVTIVAQRRITKSSSWRGTYVIASEPGQRFGEAARLAHLSDS